MRNGALGPQWHSVVALTKTLVPIELEMLGPFRHDRKVVDWDDQHKTNISFP